MKKFLYKNKKILILGLGRLGGGVATVNWFLKQGARVTVTDTLSKEELKHSIKNIKGKVRYMLGVDVEQDTSQYDTIVINPAVPFTHPLVKDAQKKKKDIQNEATVFYKHCNKKIIAITGTRGKTTTTNWTAHMLKKKHAYIAGNSTEHPLLGVLDKINKSKQGIVVNEIPSFHLEMFEEGLFAPKIAMITNIYQDHLNRHGTIENYARTKGLIFKGQSKNDILILNYDDSWTKKFLKQKPKSKIYFVSLEPLPKNTQGVFKRNNHLIFQHDGIQESVCHIEEFEKKWGSHNVSNMLTSAIASHLGGVSWKEIEKKIKSLPSIKFRQEIILKKKNLEVINDTTATSPDGGIASVKRFGGSGCVLIAGGTDGNLDYGAWGREVMRYIHPQHIILLEGSATEKMKKALHGNFEKEYKTLEECVSHGLKLVRKISKRKTGVLLFSPSAKSFEKFKNEYDRGEQFSKLIKREL